MGRPPIGKQAMSGAERTRQYRERLRHSKPVTKPSEPAQGELAAEITRLQQKLAQAHKRIAGLEAKLADAGRRELTRTRGGVEFGEAAKLRAPREYYSDRDEATLAAAKRVLALVQSIMPIPIRSAADVGCGVGTWLAVLLENDCEDIVGYDGEWVPTEYLRIPADRLIRCDLAHQRIGADKRYDLAMCLECAEHLPPEAADRLVELLCGLSDFVLFSAAVPDQTGEGHINEHWPQYWARLFSQRGYVCLDWIRSQLWTDEFIPWWYRQNILLFVHPERRAEIKPLQQRGDNLPLPLVHPHLLGMWVAAHSPTDPRSIKHAVSSIKRAIRYLMMRALPRRMRLG